MSFSSWLCLADLQNVDGLGELAGAPGAARSLRIMRHQARRSRRLASPPGSRLSRLVLRRYLRGSWGPGLGMARFAGPGEEEQAGHHDRVGVGEVRAGCGVEFVKVRGADQPHLQYLRAHGADQVSADGPAGVTGRVRLHPGLHGDPVVRDTTL